MKYLIEVVATGSEATRRREGTCAKDYGAPASGRTVFIEDLNGALRVTHLQLAVIEELPELSILKVTRLP
jgi:hypothetical protein